VAISIRKAGKELALCGVLEQLARIAAEQLALLYSDHEQAPVRKPAQPAGLEVEFEGFARGAVLVDDTHAVP